MRRRDFLKALFTVPVVVALPIKLENNPRLDLSGDFEIQMDFEIVKSPVKPVVHKMKSPGVSVIETDSGYFSAPYLPLQVTTTKHA